MALRALLITLRLNILCRQRQVIQQELYKVHISLIIQVTQDISNIIREGSFKDLRRHDLHGFYA